jgi:hypothetical protein
MKLCINLLGDSLLTFAKSFEHIRAFFQRSNAIYHHNLETKISDS